MLSFSPQVLTHWHVHIPNWLKADFHHISLWGGELRYSGGSPQWSWFRARIHCECGFWYRHSLEWELSTIRGWWEGIGEAEWYRLPYQTWLELRGKCTSITMPVQSHLGQFGSGPALGHLLGMLHMWQCLNASSRSCKDSG